MKRALGKVFSVAAAVVVVVVVGHDFAAVAGGALLKGFDAGGDQRATVAVWG
jgi:hypothetical protein